VFRFLPESTTQPAALQNNEVDLIYPQPQLDLVQQVKALPDVTSELDIGLSFEHLDFNSRTSTWPTRRSARPSPPASTSPRS
jgi:glutathione transport system substrate-binding protein